MAKLKDLTIHNLPEDVAAELERIGTPVDETVVKALRIGLGLRKSGTSNGLAALAAGWTEDEFQQFEAAVQQIGETIDEEQWR